ncbi:uncharacterized protein LOC142584414 [Dermacentor variabilis]|uniref:uncharacterized protein LOC142584414 n=1 Tax=Dermacentor variabilis TaxID=34621 RepID=UPI003F5C9FC7
MSRPPRMPFYGPPPPSTGFYRGGPQFPTPRRRPAMLSSAPHVLATPDRRNVSQGGGPSIFLPNLPPFLPLGSRPFPTGAIIRVPGMPAMVAGEPIPLAPGEPLPPYMPPPMNLATATQQAVAERQQHPAPLIILPTSGGSGGSSAPTIVPIPIPMPMPMPIPSPASAGSSSQGPIVIAPQGPTYPQPPPTLPPPPQPMPPPQQQQSASVPEVMAIMAMMRQFSTMDGAYDDDDDSSEEDRESAKERKKDKKKEKKEKKKRKKERAKERARREKAREMQRQEQLKKQEEAAKQKRPQQQMSRRKTIAEAGFNQDFS